MFIELDVKSIKYINIQIFKSQSCHILASGHPLNLGALYLCTLGSPEGKENIEMVNEVICVILFIGS